MEVVCLNNWHPACEEDRCENGCKPWHCIECGFNYKVHRKRQRLLATKGMTKCEDGLWRLMVPPVHHFGTNASAAWEFFRDNSNCDDEE